MVHQLSVQDPDCLPVADTDFHRVHYLSNLLPCCYLDWDWHYRMGLQEDLEAHKEICSHCKDHKKDGVVDLVLVLVGRNLDKELTVVAADQQGQAEVQKHHYYSHLYQTKEWEQVE